MKSSVSLWALALGALAASCLFATTNTSQPAATETVVLIVRHAEKAPSPAMDPPLSEAGRARAEALAHVAGKAGVKAAFATEYLRTQQTLEPMAKLQGLEVASLKAEDVGELTAGILRDHRGEVVLVAGHSNTVPKIIEALGGGAVEPIADDQYDDLFVLYVSDRGPARVVRLRYGGPSN